MIGLGVPRRCAATAAPVAPVPDARVSPTPRSKIRARTREPSACQKLTLVRFGKIGACSIAGPIAGRSRSSRPESISIAHWGLPIETCWNSRSLPPTAIRPTPSVPPSG